MSAKLKMVISVECDIKDEKGVDCKYTAEIVADTILSALRGCTVASRHTKVTSCEYTLLESFKVDL